MQTVAVVDYGSSNLRSVWKALTYVAQSTQHIQVSDDPERILAADRVVIPGQGAIAQCMAGMKEKGLDQVLKECLKTKPFLGICMGLQTLMDWSDEDGGVQGLRIIAGAVRRFPDGAQDASGVLYKIPHMGWNRVDQAKPHPLWEGISTGERFYFVHSYFVEPDNAQDTAATSDYAVTFTSALARDNLFAVQFHPEKSQRAGLKLLQNFLSWL
jgi:glutamine amidotransferase